VGAGDGVSWAVLRRKTSKPRSRGDEAAKRRLAAPASGISAPLALVKSERDPSEQDSAHCPLGTGVAGHSAPRVGSIRKRRRSLIADRPACGGGEPPCYQHLFEGLGLWHAIDPLRAASGVSTRF
jgi:hypothetical protein